MLIELDPPTGITGFHFGMPAEEVKQAAAALGEVTVNDEGVAQEWAHMTVDIAHPQVDITLNLEDGKTLTSVNIFRPRPGPEEITVTWQGIDIFATRADEILDRIADAGHRIHDREFLFPLVPGLSLGFSRDPAGDDDFPMDEETGVADFFLSVLTSTTTYYDAVLAEIDRMGL
ncbi:hypothetical protein [Catenulispora sp. EB89]|uniref:hypothetical protein n=1 Tax=Catenulispora sp. EB89 TaxID=3156257 RepID=UPI0035162CF7